MKKLLTILALMLVAFTANAQIAKWMKPSKVSSAILKGDTNGDGEITVADVMLTVNYVLGKESSSFNSTNADVNGDGEITIADANNAIEVIVNGGSSGGHSRVPNPNGGFWINIIDANHDGEVNIADINAIIDMILGN